MRTQSSHRLPKAPDCRGQAQARSDCTECIDSEQDPGPILTWMACLADVRMVKKPELGSERGISKTFILCFCTSESDSGRDVDPASEAEKQDLGQQKMG